MKKITVLILVAAMLLTAGCASKSAPLKIDPTAAADKLASTVHFVDQMSPVDEKMALKLYGLDQTSVSKEKVYESTGATAEEIAVFEAKDEAGAAKIKTAAQKRIEDQKAGFQDYQPKEMAKLKNPVLVTNGNYVFLCVSDENDTAKKIIDGFMK